MEENKIIYVDFSSKTKTHEETIQPEKVKEEKLDPVLEKVKEEMDESNFEIYKKVVDDWMRRCFEYDMDMRNNKD